MNSPLPFILSLLPEIPDFAVRPVNVDWKVGESRKVKTVDDDADVAENELESFLKRELQHTIILKHGIISTPAFGAINKNVIIYSEKGKSSKNPQIRFLLFWKSALSNVYKIFRNDVLGVRGRPLLQLQLFSHLKALYNFKDEWEFVPTWNDYVAHPCDFETIQPIIMSFTQEYLNTHLPWMKLKCTWNDFTLTDLAVKNLNFSHIRRHNTNPVTLYTLIYEYKLSHPFQKRIQFGVAVEISRLQYGDIGEVVASASTGIHDLQYSNNLDIEDYLHQINIPIIQADYVPPEQILQQNTWYKLGGRILRLKSIQEVIQLHGVLQVHLEFLSIREIVSKRFLFIACKLTVPSVNTFYFNVLVEVEIETKLYEKVNISRIVYTPKTVFWLRTWQGKRREYLDEADAATLLFFESEEASYNIK